MHRKRSDKNIRIRFEREISRSINETIAHFTCCGNPDYREAARVIANHRRQLVDDISEGIRFRYRMTEKH